MDTKHRTDLSSATVIPYGDGQAYRLLRVGAVMSNDTTVGGDEALMTLDSVNDDTTKDVPAVYMLTVSDSGCQFAVRVVNIPAQYADHPIYARPYYVFEKDGQEIVVYGTIYSRSYNG